MGLDHIPDIACTEYGTPLISDIYHQAQRTTTHDLVCYINADIILMSDFMQTVTRVAQARPRFLMGGQRWDVDITAPLDFSPGWEDRLRDIVQRQGTLHAPTGIDFFVFPRGMIDAMPPFAIGRPGWDPWLLYHVRSRNIPVIDATRSVMIVHQNHDYGHVPKGSGHSYQGPEAQKNLSFLPDKTCYFTLNYATELLTPRGLIPARELRHLREYHWAWLALHPTQRHTLRKIWRTFLPFNIRFSIINMLNTVLGRRTKKPQRQEVL
jgi:hypothetical protein